MADNKYWNDLLSMVVRALSDAAYTDAVYVAKTGEMEIRYDYHDNWDGGIDYFEIIFHLKYKDYTSIEKRREEICEQIAAAVSRFHNDPSERISGVAIEPLIERVIDWKAILPESKMNTIELIKQEQIQLEANATGKASYKESGAEEQYQARHQRILQLSRRAGFDYPIPYNSLAEWWSFIKTIPGYADRRTHLSELFHPIIEGLSDSEENPGAVMVDFQRISSRANTIALAIDDANLFMREGKFDSSLDRIQSAFCGYLRELLNTHAIAYSELDTLQQLYAKLHTFYGNTIQPPEIAELVKTAIKSGSGIIHVINDARNKHTIVHPNKNLIGKREAILVLQLTKAIVDYLEDIEKSLLL